MDGDTPDKQIFKMVNCGSKGLTPTQQRYSTIELECMAIVWAILKCSFYLRGLPRFTVYTDHKPLFGVFKRTFLISPALVYNVFVRKCLCFPLTLYGSPEEPIL